MGPLIARLRTAARWLGEFFDLIEPEPPRLNCGDVDSAARYVCPHCGHATCENHRTDPHTCRGADA